MTGTASIHTVPGGNKSNDVSRRVVLIHPDAACSYPLCELLRKLDLSKLSCKSLNSKKARRLATCLRCGKPSGMQVLKSDRLENLSLVRP